MDKKIIFISTLLLFIPIFSHSAASFDGIDDNITIAATNNVYLVLRQTQPFSVCGWVKPRNFGFRENCIISNWSSTANKLGFAIETDVNRFNVYLVKQTVANENIYSPSIVQKLNVWYHFAFTFDTKQGICYANGIPGVPEVIDYGALAQPVVNTWELGSLSAGTWWGDCVLADIRVYNVNLSQARINWIMKNPGVQDSGLVIHWKLDKNHKDYSDFKWGCSPVGVAFPDTSIKAVDNPPTYFEQDNQKD